MVRRSLCALAVVALQNLAHLGVASAQFAVIDVASIAQLVQQYQTLQQELTTTQLQLTQAQQQYQSMTGTRGMQSLLNGINRNYLPSSWTQLPAAFAAPLQTKLAQNAILSPPQVALLSSSEREHLAAARANAALFQVTTQQAYATTSARFATLQQLINAIPSANDAKGTWELQARIGAEQGMLANDSAKLDALYHAVQAEEWAQRQRRQEQAIADIGSLRALPAMGLH